jgi:hypothetical protein
MTMGKPSPEHRLWYRLRDISTNPETPLFRFYGSRRLGLCAQWLDDFDRFFAYIGKRPAGAWLIRIDKSKPYRPHNVPCGPPRPRVAES